MSKAAFRQIQNSFSFLVPPRGDSHVKGQQTKSLPESTNDSGISIWSESDESQEDAPLPSPTQNMLKRILTKKMTMSFSAGATMIRKDTMEEPNSTAHARIEDIRNGKHVHRSIRPNHKLMKYTSITEMKSNDVVSLIQNNYRRNEEGFLEMVNSEISQKQKEVAGKIAKQLGTAIFSKKGISLPLSIFEPHSMLEKVALNFIYAPNFLGPVASIPDALEQFRCTLTFWLASLHTNVWLYKPFNPILGETFQGYIEETPVYLEQVSHHPPICCYQMISEKFQITGRFEAQASSSTNSLKTKSFGFPKISFKNTKANIVAFMPTFNVNGTMFGKKTYDISQKLVVVDFENQYYAEIEFGGEGGGFWGGGKKQGKDAFSSAIYKVNANFLQKLKKDMQANKELGSKFKPKDDAIEKLDDIEGSWLTHVTIGPIKYWTFGVDIPSQLNKLHNPLPSDTTYRPDVLHLKVNDEKTAQKEKERLEEVQRKDKKLREKNK